jgi:hypothetical protein
MYATINGHKLYCWDVARPVKYNYVMYELYLELSHVIYASCRSKLIIFPNIHMVMNHTFVNPKFLTDRRARRRATFTSIQHQANWGTDQAITHSSQQVKPAIRWPSCQAAGRLRRTYPFSIQPVRLGWNLAVLVGFLWEKNTAEWLADLADNLKRIGWLLLAGPVCGESLLLSCYILGSSLAEESPY